MHPVNTSIGKKSVHYIGEPVFTGNQAVLQVMDHPDFPVGYSVITSPIVSKNDTGRIETFNTIYFPE